MECESKLDNPGSPEREGGDRDAGAEGGTEGMADCDGLKGAEETEDSKKRKRKPYRPGKPTTSNNHKIAPVKCLQIVYFQIASGIGGFMVRQRKCHTRMKKEFFAQLAGETTLDGQPIERTIEEGW